MSKTIEIKGERINKATCQGLYDLVNYKGGATIVSSWISGSGRHTKLRPIPPFCDRIAAWEVDQLRGYARKAAKREIKNSPRCQFLIVCTDIRSANRALKHAFPETH